MSEEIKSAYELQQETQKKLFEKCHEDKKGLMDLDIINPEKVKSLCQKHAEIIQDFRSVKEINQVMSFRFDEVLALLPTPQELDLAITRIYDLYEQVEANDHIKRLMSFRKVLVAVQAEETIRPKSYAESVETKEVK